MQVITKSLKFVSTTNAQPKVYLCYPMVMPKYGKFWRLKLSTICVNSICLYANKEDDVIAIFKIPDLFYDSKEQLCGWLIVMTRTLVIT